MKYTFCLGFSTLPVENYGTTAQLPDEIMLNGQEHYKTTRGALLWNRGLSALASAIPINAVQRIPKVLTNYNNKKNNPKKNEEKDDESEYEYEYEYEDEDDENDDDDDDGKNENYDKRNGKKVAKGESSPELNRKKRISDTGDNREKKKTENKKQENKKQEKDRGAENGREETDSEYDSFEDD